MLTYELAELTGTRLRAVYQRRKGRDLFDLWKILSMHPELDKVTAMLLASMIEGLSQPWLVAVTASVLALNDIVSD